MKVIATIAAVLLGLYVLTLAVVLVMPARQHNPQIGVAQGCVFGLILGLLSVGGVLYLAIHFQLRPLIILVFLFTIFPFISLVGGSIYHLVRKFRGLD